MSLTIDKFGCFSLFIELGWFFRICIRCFIDQFMQISSQFDFFFEVTVKGEWLCWGPVPFNTFETWCKFSCSFAYCRLPPTAHRPPPPVPFRFINLRADLNVLIMTSPAGRVSGELRFDYANEPREICIWRRRRLMNLMQMSRLKTQLTHTHTQTHKQITNRILNIELNQLFSPGFCYFINHMQMSQFPEELIRTNF